MSRLIDADAIPWVHGRDGDIVTYPDMIAEMPTIEPERKRGKWKPISDGYIDIYECDCCGNIEDYERNFCPNCGAGMSMVKVGKPIPVKIEDFKFDEVTE